MGTPKHPSEGRQKSYMGSPKMYRGTPKTPHTNGPQNHTGGRTLRTAVVCSSKAKKPTGCKDAGLYVQKSAFCRLNKDGVVGKKEGNTKLWHRYISAKRNSSTYKQVVRVCCCKDLSACLRFLRFFFLFRRGHAPFPPPHPPQCHPRTVADNIRNWTHLHPPPHPTPLSWLFRVMKKIYFRETIS